MKVGNNLEQPLMELLEDQLNVVKPHVNYHEGFLEVNYDVLLNLDGDEDLYVPYSDRVVGCKRQPKNVQIYRLNKAGFKTPKTTFKVNIENKYDIMTMLNGYEDEVVVKALNGARGIGSTVIAKNKIYEFILACEAKNSDYIKTQTDIGNNHSTNEEIEYLMDSINSREYIIQEKVKIKQEFRLIWFYNGESIIFERSNKDGWKCNLDYGKPQLEFKIVEDIYNDEYKDKLSSFFKEFRSPFMSVDLYIDEEDNMGIFEYQMQFGIRNLILSNNINFFAHNTILSIEQITATK